tara:strand:+ start:313 stop:981 length:669 start_codon:yes stop_codon:yes gene_type:complete
MALIASSAFLISVSDIKLHLNIGTSGPDGWLDKAVSSVTKRIETFCRRTFIATQYTEFHDGSGRRGFVYVDNPPIVAIDELNDDVNRDFGNSTKFATSEFVSYDDEGRIELLNQSDLIPAGLQTGVVFSQGQQNIKIVYTGGFADVPEDIRMGAAEWVSKLYHRRDKKRWGHSASSKGDTSVTFESIGLMPEDVKGFVSPYRIVRRLEKIGRRNFSSFRGID